jgi:hypothetical protein
LVGIGVGATVGTGVGVGVGAGAEVTLTDVDAKVAPDVEVDFGPDPTVVLDRAETPCEPADSPAGIVMETEKLPTPFARKAIPVEALSSTRTPFTFFAKPEPRTVIAAPAVVELGEADSCAEVAAVTLGATSAAIRSAGSAIAFRAIEARERPDDLPRTTDAKMNCDMVRLPTLADFESTARWPRGRAVWRQYRYGGGAPRHRPCPDRSTDVA